MHRMSSHCEHFESARGRETDDVGKELTSTYLRWILSREQIYNGSGCCQKSFQILPCYVYPGWTALGQAKKNKTLFRFTPWSEPASLHETYRLNSHLYSIAFQAMTRSPYIPLQLLTTRSYIVDSVARNFTFRTKVLLWRPRSSSLRFSPPPLPSPYVNHSSGLIIAY